jgi:hypothetical protein
MPCRDGVVQLANSMTCLYPLVGEREEGSVVLVVGIVDQ